MAKSFSPVNDDAFKIKTDNLRLLVSSAIEVSHLICSKFPPFPLIRVVKFKRFFEDNFVFVDQFASREDELQYHNFWSIKHRSNIFVPGNV